MKRINYTVEELIGDDSFRRWVEGTATPKEEKRWNHWVNSHQKHRRLASEAAQLLVGFTFQRPEMPVIEHEWATVKGRIESLDRGKFHLDRRLRGRYSWLYAAAAAILLFVLVGIGYYTGFWNSNASSEQIASVKEKTISTGSNEQKTITLSDGSQIVLKSNASLTYYDGWISGKKVRIRLQGEAYFSIVHRSSSDRPELQVTTPEGIIHDMGTKFVVSTGPNSTTVVLEEGAVSVEPKGEMTPGKTDRIAVAPGELVEVNSDGNVTKKSVNPTLYTSWATGVFKFDYTPVTEFAQRVEKMYDIKVIINPELIGKKINGAVYYRGIGELVKAVSQVLKVPVYRSVTGDTIYIGQKINNN